LHKKLIEYKFNIKTLLDLLVQVFKIADFNEVRRLSSNYKSSFTPLFKGVGRKGGEK